jgi:CPA1 family monovalent cation:H+ antiporter
MSAHADVVLLAVLFAAAAFLVTAYRTGIPYPILLVVGGAILGFIPGMPDTRLDPKVVLVIFLPPLLYSAAFFSSLRDLRANLKSISALSIGLVIWTTVAVAVVAHAVIRELSWEAAFVLGAVLSPTDAVAATAIAGRVGAPRRFVTIIEGESLVNDSSALIVYKFAVAAAVAGGFSLFDAGLQFILRASAGVAIGLVVGWLIVQLRRHIDDAPTEIAVSLVTPYFAYLPAEAIGVSAVLAAVTSGIFLGWHSPRLITPTTRIQAFSTWEILVFVLNAALFVLVGLELPGVIDGVRGSFTAGTLAGYGAVVTLAVVVTRFLWVYPVTYVPFFMWRGLGESAPWPSWRFTFLVGWSGMRGAVSLAAALAIPLTTHARAAFPARDLVIFLTYVVVFVTVVVQGLLLPLLIRAFGLEGEDDRDHEAKARLKAARAALARIDELLADEDWVREESAQRMRRLYEFRVRRFEARFGDGDDGGIEDGSLAYQRLRREALEAERAEVIRLRNQGRINDAIMRRIERDLDLEDARLEI